ncbi:polysaccharide deacetylase family protein [Syntrophomonas palmitatica]|uniref:polysaccharide deacetylase family protein n=1 Tax=Syntrophomonas palmitatica TaxID=402877 RepID=UPI0006CF3F09|nr:polysaccharide deacetylase family protein [Syntrophomonas palmitatica]
MTNKIKSFIIKILVIVVLLIFISPVLMPEIGLSYSGIDRDIQVSEKVVALTFDDGPYPQVTPQILDVLDQYHARATFFMIGERMEQYPEMVKQVANRGHVIANHTYNHPDDLKKLNNKQMENELDKTESVILSLTGQSFYLFRPPRGILNERLIKVINNKNYQIVLWGISADHHDAPTPEMMAARVVKHVHPGEVVLLHDGRFPGRIKDIEATRLILQELSGQGYRFVTLPELILMNEKNKVKDNNKNPLEKQKPLWHNLRYAMAPRYE